MSETQTEETMDLVSMSDETAHLAKLLYTKLTTVPEVKRRFSGTMRITLAGVQDVIDDELKTLQTKM